MIFCAALCGKSPTGRPLLKSTCPALGRTRRMKMPETMYVKPARDGVLLRNPATGESIPPEGAAVTLGPYRVFWLRRIKDGDALAVATKEATDKDSNVDVEE